MKRRLLIPVLAAGALVAAGCGGSGGDGGDGATTTATATTQAAAAPAGAPTVRLPAALARKPTVRVPSGPAPHRLVVKDIVRGTGARARRGDGIVVNYVGVLYRNGRQFDASWDRNQPFSFQLGAGQVIRGWDRGIVGMRVGGRRELIIPARLGYGARGAGDGAIPPGATLVFVVDLRQITHS